MASSLANHHSLLQQGVSYSISMLTLPSLLRLPSSASASHALASLSASLKAPLLALTSLAAAPFLLSFALSARSARHPYLLYTSLLAVLSGAAPRFLPGPAPRAAPAAAAAAGSKKNAQASRRMMEASYEVLGDVHSEPASEEDIDVDIVNGEEVRAEVQGLARAYFVRTGLAALGFAMAVVGIWGDGAPQAMVVVS